MQLIRRMQVKIVPGTSMISIVKGKTENNHGQTDNVADHKVPVITSIVQQLDNRALWT